MAKGIDGYNGYLFGDVTQGDTLPFTFYFRETDKTTPVDVTGWRAYVSFTRYPTRSGVPDLEATLLPQDAVNGIISGEVADSDVLMLEEGLYVAVAKYVKSDGRSYPIDKALVNVFPAANNRVGQ